MTSIAEHLVQIRDRIANAAAQDGRTAAAVTLVAVSKFHGADAVSEAIGAGQLVFGENRVQEAAGKFPDLRAATPGLALHLIGPLQTNKVREATATVDVIETLDRPRLADALAAAQDRGERLPRLLVQVNVGEEPQKAGIAPADADAFIRDCQARFGAQLAGLMCIPPIDERPGPPFRGACQPGGAPRACGRVDGHVRRLRGRDPPRCDPRTGRQRHIRPAHRGPSRLRAGRWRVARLELC